MKQGRMKEVYSFSLFIFIFVQNEMNRSSIFNIKNSLTILIKFQINFKPHLLSNLIENS